MHKAEYDELDANPDGCTVDPETGEITERKPEASK